MATGRVDQKVMCGLLGGMLQQVAGCKVLFPFQPEPDEYANLSTCIVRWHGLRTAPHEPDRSGDPNAVEFTMHLSVVSPPKATKADGWELDTIVSRIADVFLDYEAQASPGTHYLDGLDYERSDVIDRDHGQLRMCGMTITGVCRRQSGTSLT